jgi:Ca2+-binding EF-hand superfamily protein
VDFVDTDKNGKINYTEFIASTLEDHLLSSKENLRNVFNMLDKDGNGYVDKNEVRSILSQHGHINSEKT